MRRPPLTWITAWEMLFDRLDVNRQTAQGDDTILVIGGAGGVGSITIQLLRAPADLTVIATASRPETQDWVRQCGAHHVIDHRQALAPQVEALGLGAPRFVFSTTQTDRHLADIVELIAPQGRFGLIDDPEELDAKPFKTKAVSLHMAQQGKLLNEITALVDAGRIRSTATDVAGGVDAATLRSVHALIESGKAPGKVVLEGF